MQTVQDSSLLDQLLEKAKQAGAEDADAVILRSTSLSHGCRLGKTESLEREESQDLGLRVLIGQRQAMVSTTDLNSDSQNELVDRAIAMARIVPEDDFCGLAAPEQLAQSIPDIDSLDSHEPSAETLIELAQRCEEAALAVTGISNSEGAEASWGRTTVSLASSRGFTGSYAVSRHSLGVSVLAGEGQGMERDYDFTSCVYAEDMDAPEEVGHRAAEKAIGRLNPRKTETGKMPLVFDPRIGNSLLGHFAGAINGAAIARGTSFLKDTMNTAIFAENIEIIDDPLRKRGLRSRPFDGEGLPTTRQTLVEKGVLNSWLLDLATARQLGLNSTGHASRGVSSPPSPSASNLYIAAGQRSRDELIGEIENGLLITEMMGMGVNLLTGDYSRGAAGYLIEKGEITVPVSEITIAGHLSEMFKAMEAASDLEFKYGTNVPTLRIDGMMVAGS